MSLSINIPLPLMESLKVVFEKEGKNLAESIADSLGLPRKEVVKKIFSKKAAINVFDWDGPSRCSKTQNENSHIIQICGRPTLLGTTKCILHQKESDSDTTEPLQKVRKLVVESYEEGSLWLNEETNKVCNSNGEYIGWMENGELFEVEFQ